MSNSQIRIGRKTLPDLGLLRVLRRCMAISTSRPERATSLRSAISGLGVPDEFHIQATCSSSRTNLGKLTGCDLECSCWSLWIGGRVFECGAGRNTSIVRKFHCFSVMTRCCGCAYKSNTFFKQSRCFFGSWLLSAPAAIFELAETLENFLESLTTNLGFQTRRLSSCNSWYPPTPSPPQRLRRRATALWPLIPPTRDSILASTAPGKIQEKSGGGRSSGCIQK